MARAQGARSQLAVAFETVYGTPPASGFTRLPFASSTLSAEQPLLDLLVHRIERVAVAHARLLVTQARVQQLVDNGNVERVPNPADGRSHLLRTTAAGREALDRGDAATLEARFLVKRHLARSNCSASAFPVV